MKLLSLSLLAIAATIYTPSASANCLPGVYRSTQGDFVVLAQVPQIPSPGLRYLFRDGRRGSTAAENPPLACDGEMVRVDQGAWGRVAFTETDTSFSSVGTKLAGRLIEPGKAANAKPPLVVMVHGSERTAAIGSIYAHALAAQGIAVFVYDKRGTGASEGEYTQNFELLAEDAAAALRHAKSIARGRLGRAGFFGGSQGGWVAPLASLKIETDFVAVGFGLVASPIEEDREQMISEVRALGLGTDAEALVNDLSAATAKLLLTDFSEGFDELATVKAKLAAYPWAPKIAGEHSGAILKLDEAQLRRVGRARFDNLELIWDYDATAALKRMKAPLLWVLAAEDREAPIEGTRRALLDLKASGKKIDAYVFPDTDHGMFEFTANADGSRSVTRITDGYLQLLGDWIKGTTKTAYGRSQVLNGQIRNTGVEATDGDK